MSDAISVLKEQHRAVHALIMQLERAQTPALRAHIFRSIDANLRIHAAIEEKIFYPAFREHAQKDAQRREVEQNLHEHDELKTALGEVERADPASPSYMNKVENVKRLVMEHVAEEELKMFRQAHRLFTSLELQDLGFRMEKAATMESPVYAMA
jgi:hemerythrin superfamily protein